MKFFNLDIPVPSKTQLLIITYIACCQINKAISESCIPLADQKFDLNNPEDGKKMGDMLDSLVKLSCLAAKKALETCVGSECAPYEEAFNKYGCAANLGNS